MRKHIKLMADYESHPLWWAESDKVGNIDPETLQLKPETVSSLYNWADIYDCTLNLDDPYASGFSSEEEEANFEAEGLRLWKQLQNELGNTFKITYYSYKQNKVLNDFSELSSG